MKNSNGIRLSFKGKSIVADKVFNRTLWNGDIVATYQKKIGNKTYQCNSPKELIEASESHVDFIQATPEGIAEFGTNH